MLLGVSVGPGCQATLLKILVDAFGVCHFSLSDGWKVAIHAPQIATVNRALMLLLIVYAMNGSIVRQQNYFTGQKTPYARTGRRYPEVQSLLPRAIAKWKPVLPSYLRQRISPFSRVSFSVHCLSDLRPISDAIKRWRGRNVTNHSAVVKGRGFASVPQK